MTTETNTTPATTEATKTAAPKASKAKGKAKATKAKAKPQAIVYKVPKVKGDQFTEAASRKLRLATAKEAKIVAYIEGITGTKVPEATKKNRKALIKLAREHGWGYHGNVVDPAKKAQYGASQSCGDKVADVMARVCRTINEDGSDYIDMDKMWKVAKQNGLTLDRWLHCNIGQIRMNLGNVLRGKVRRGEYVVVGDLKVDGREWNAKAKQKAA